MSNIPKSWDIYQPLSPSAWSSQKRENDPKDSADIEPPENQIGHFSRGKPENLKTAWEMCAMVKPSELKTVPHWEWPALHAGFSQQWYLVILGWDPHHSSSKIPNHPQSPGLVAFFSRRTPSPWNPGRPNRSHCSRVWRRKAWQSAPIRRITVATWVISHVPIFHITQPLGINGLLDGYQPMWYSHYRPYTQNGTYPMGSHYRPL